MDDLKRIEVSRILIAIKGAMGQQEKLIQTADLLAELGVIVDTPSMKVQWRSQ